MEQYTIARHHMGSSLAEDGEGQVKATKLGFDFPQNLERFFTKKSSVEGAWAVSSSRSNESNLLLAPGCATKSNLLLALGLVRRGLGEDDP
mmetsp:Transcript_12624/g.31032  ORF Transcript_12624/g.31032 Transcript_12624/m.31032 type:complete len:91 (+) Transcript_12624:248-520(+)|eukprot:CAMPEP_0114523306 /NCGR_PEP_ID=MMETSP0109-20121206/21220_1 /TAXON_ID=29199 /ORGANISM="Chlorarachnion reptans, Strain CCCM449" /LENGTH=90 /DNA_ID=CAMNT_0001704611 /DNA_START=177 /DNA_END=449 /DNA_ORIENTATION=-